MCLTTVNSANDVAVLRDTHIGVIMGKEEKEFLQESSEIILGKR